jgi:DNA-binding response OmpR family regulator
MSNILIVEDNYEIVEILKDPLGTAGYTLIHSPSIKDAKTKTSFEKLDLILLDINLPDGNGIDFCKELRQNSTIPIIMLTARKDEIDRILGLEFGADDYIVKPFSPREVVARINAVLRRHKWDSEGKNKNDNAKIYSYAGLYLDEDRRELILDSKNISLTNTEFRLVKTFLKRPGIVFSRNELIELVWDGAFISDRVVDSIVSRLRRKLGKLPNGKPRITTVHGTGYKLTEIEK